MKVRVRTDLQETFIGYAVHARRRPGDVFTLPAANDNDVPYKNRDLTPGERKLIERDPRLKDVYESIKDKDGKVHQLFSFRWMEPVAQNVPEKISTSQEALNAASEKISGEKAAAREATTGVGGQNAEVL